MKFIGGYSATRIVNVLNCTMEKMIMGVLCMVDATAMMYDNEFL